MPSPPRLILIDTFGLIFRAYYGRAKSGAPLMRTSSGMPTEAVYIFSNMMHKLLADHKPDYVAAVWEGEGPTFRDEIFEDYKANREETPDDLVRQMPYIERLLEANRVPILSAAGYEADDVIGALARQAVEHDVDVYVVSSDKDLTQLVTDRVYVLNPMKNDLVYDSAKVEEIMGVSPRKMADLLALKGDSVDNIPGAPGIGDKGARDLIAQYGSVESAMEHAGEVKRKTYRESLQQNRDQILLSKKLATIAVDAPVELDLEALRAAQPSPEALRELYKELEFNSLLSRLEGPEPEVKTELRTFSSNEEFQSLLDGICENGGATVAIAVGLRGAGEIETGGVGFCADPKEGVLLPASLLPAAKRFLEEPARRKRMHDAKPAMQVLEQAGISLQGLADDTLLAAFLTNPIRSDYSLEKTALRRLGVKVEGNPGSAAAMTQRLGEVLSREIDELKLRDLYEQIELPLAAVLARMESSGVLLDCNALALLSGQLEGDIDSLAQEIHALAGTTFNINSPKQLSKVLFEDLGLPAPSRRGKTKTPSTASDVLEGLALNHEIAAKILDYRQFTKLKNTYVDALPLLVNPKTRRLHTTFNQTGAATGRVSSANPNLQNIPVRTELGRRIRAAFLSRPGWNLLKADYSQIELRILAHMSGDKVLVDAFGKGEDIHTRTAAEVFGVPPLMIGPEERRRAKAVNFGIVYGLSPFGRQLGIPASDARAYIDAYFQLYSGVKAFIDRTIAQVRKSGVTRTLFGRLRPIPDIDSKNANARGFAERTAINSPIQGSAADLIKLAMIRVDRRLRDEQRQALMLLQVHDELLLEVPEQETAEVAKLVKNEMEQVHRLDVPLVAEVKAGKNWRDMRTV